MPHYKFDQIAYNITDKKIPEPGDEKTYIGLEHLDSGSLKVTRWGNEVELKGQKLVMKKGDLLFGKRNTYLRRAAIAPHDGIFSAHGMIFRPKTEVIDPEYFPFFISSNYFMDAAIRISVGSLSPTVNWKTLKELEFDIPTLEEQKKNAELLNAINDTKEAYQELLLKTDDLVKSQFIERIENDKSIPKAKLRDLFDISSGGTPKRSKNEYLDGGKIPWVKISDMKSMYLTETEEFITELGLEKSSAKLYKAGTFLISIFATLGRVSILDIDATTNQAIAGMVPKSDIDVEYTYIALNQLKDHILEIGRGAAQNNINLSILKELVIPMPEEKIRREFSEFVQQSDKAKFELQQAIESTDNLIKSILYSNLEENKE